MRILHISSARSFGDAERHLTRLARELAGRGHEVFIALRPTSEWRDSLDFLAPENFVNVSVRNSFGMLSVRRISRFVNEREIDIVHAHSGKDYLAASVVRRMARDTRVVLTRHIDQPLKPFHKYALRHVDAAIAVSPSIREHLAQTFPAERIYIVANGIDPAETTVGTSDFRSFHGIPHDAPLVATIGELKASAGTRDLVLAAHEVARKLPDCYFVVAGSDRSVDKKFRRELKRLVKVLGLNEKFLWLEKADAGLLPTVDLLVVASHRGELTSSTIDAMAAGKAVVTTATDDIIDPGSMVPAMEPIVLAERMMLFLTDKEFCRAAASRGQATVRDRFSLARMIDETENVYRTVLDR